MYSIYENAFQIIKKQKNVFSTRWMFEHWQNKRWNFLYADSLSFNQYVKLTTLQSFIPYEWIFFSSISKSQRNWKVENAFA